MNLNFKLAFALGCFVFAPTSFAQDNQPADLGLAIELRGLNKVTGRMQTLVAETGTPQRFGQLEITAFTCTKAPPEEQPESTAFLQIDEVGSDGEDRRIFSGWMFASTPALNALEHPVYDVWITDCRTVEGEGSSSSR